MNGSPAGDAVSAYSFVEAMPLRAIPGDTVDAMDDGQYKLFCGGSSAVQRYSVIFLVSKSRSAN
jgi:hypothetical protein